MCQLHIPTPLANTETFNVACTGNQLMPYISTRLLALEELPLTLFIELPKRGLLGKLSIAPIS
jgi:hypothetical protein